MHNTWYQWINFTKTFQLTEKLKEILMIHLNSSTESPSWNINMELDALRKEEKVPGGQRNVKVCT